MTKNNRFFFCSNSIKRRLYSSSGCEANCKYCFSKWNNTYISQPTMQSEKIHDDISVVYPSCDGDIINDKKGISELWQLVNNSKKIIVSMSTKCNIKEVIMNALIEINNYLVKNDKGFVKLSISLSTKTMIEKIEENALPYARRFDLLRQMTELGFYTSATIKPILPFVPNEEYYEIIDDCRSVVDRILIGGLYVDRSSEFYKQFIKDKYNITQRSVQWLNSHPMWDYVVQEEKIKQIYTYGVSKNLLVFDTDVDLIKSLLAKANTKVS